MELQKQHLIELYVSQRCCSTKFEKSLAPPFSLDEIMDFESRNGMILPELFRFYLLNISREIACSRIVVDLDSETGEQHFIDGLCGTYPYNPSHDGWDYDHLIEGTLDITCNASVIVKGIGYGKVIVIHDSKYEVVDELYRYLTPHPIA